MSRSAKTATTRRQAGQEYLVPPAHPPAPATATTPLLSATSNNTTANTTTNNPPPTKSTQISKSSIEVRNAFYRKVYVIVWLAGFAFLHHPEIAEIIKTRIWIVYITAFLAGATLMAALRNDLSMGGKLSLVVTFTVLKGAIYGFLISLFEAESILRALIFTSCLAFGLVVWSCQIQWDFTNFIGLFFVSLTSGAGGIASMVYLLPIATPRDLARTGLCIAVIILCVLFNVYNAGREAQPFMYIETAHAMYLEVVAMMAVVVAALSVMIGALLVFCTALACQWGTDPIETAA